MNAMVPRVCALVAGIAYLGIAAFASVPVAAFCVDDPNASGLAIGVCVLAIVAVPLLFLLASLSLIVSFFLTRTNAVRVVQWAAWLSPWALVVAYLLWLAVSGA